MIELLNSSGILSPTPNANSLRTRGVWHWFIEGVLAPLPNWVWRAAYGIGRPVDVALDDIEREGIGLNIVRERSRRLPVRLVIPDAHCFTLAVEVPRAAMSKIESVLRLELARSTPFKLEDVYIGYASTKATPTNAHFVMKIARRDQVERAIALIQGTGQGVFEVVCDADPRLVTLADFSRHHREARKFWALSNSGLSLTAVALGAALISLPALERAQHLSELEQTFQALQAEAITLREKMTDMRTAAEAANQKETWFLAHPSAVELIKQLTNALPQEVWVSELQFSGNTVVFTGHSSHPASEVVLAFDALEWVRTPRLLGSVATDRVSGQERFELRFELTQ